MCHGSCANGRWMMFIGSVETAIKKAVAKVIETARILGLLKEHHTGGYFCLKMIGEDGFLIKPMLVGEVPKSRRDECIKLCQEKANRLEAEYLADRKNTKSSWQTRNPENDKWGGATLGPDSQERQYAFSFSGLPELCDEVATLLTAVEVGHLTPDEAIEIAEISGSDDLLIECGEFAGLDCTIGGESDR